MTTRRQRGVTLVELMIALVLGTLLTAGMIQVFIGNRTTYAFNDSLSRIQENARFALDHMAYNARMAGYKGCISDVSVYNNLSTNVAFRDDIEDGIRGYDYNGTSDGDTFTASANPTPSTNTGNWTPALPGELAGRVIPGSDVLVVRGISGAPQELVSPFSDSSQLFVEKPHNFLLGEILVVTDCQKASIFQFTNVTDTGFGVNLVHSQASYTPGNAVSVWDSDQSYGLGAEVARLSAYAFYVGIGEDGRPALFQYRLGLSGGGSAFAAEELAPGVDSLQLRFGVDADADGAVDSLVSADQVTDWRRVLSADLSLLVAASEEYGTEVDRQVYRLGLTRFDPADDRRLRQVFSTSVGVRNRLP